jgi:transcription initiation factor TFIIE subunit alpha
MVGEKRDLVSEILYEMIGNEGIRIVNSLHRPSTDLQIHDKTRIPITRIRTTLNMMHKFDIVSYNSPRDEEKGWFKYTWELKKGHVDSSIRNYLMSKMMRLKREFQEISQVDFFKCENGCVRLSFTDAYDRNFRCARCNGVLKPVDSAAESRQIKRETDQLRKIMEIIGPMSGSLKVQSPA